MRCFVGAISALGVVLFMYLLLTVHTPFTLITRAAAYFFICYLVLSTK